MRLAALFSGGKDSCYALHLARRQGHEIVCLLTVISENPESFMFHTPNIRRTEAQAEAMGLPLLTITTKGEKELELKELAALIKRAKEEFAIEGVVSGAIESSYQKTRIERICSSFGLTSLTPLWKTDQLAYLRRLLQDGFEVVIVGVFAEPFDESWLGRRIDGKTIAELERFARSHGIQPSGEGGELETFVCDGPGWNARIVIEDSEKEYENFAGTLTITKLKLSRK